MLINLVENAVKYSPDGGPVNIGLEREAHVLWSVSDQGLGIPRVRAPAVFEKFYRLDPEHDPRHRRHRARALHLP